MTETRAPFNGKKKEPIGVFVRLHDGMLDEKQIAALCNPKRSSTENILTIGTPVTGGELEVVGYADAAALPLEDGGPTNWTADINAKPDETCTVPLVRQSDALAKLAEKDAEIARYREALIEAKTFHEEQDKSLSKQPPSSQGSWRRNLHQEQIEQIEAALKGGAA